ncbi:hypothetical protein GCM10023333_20870 [Ferrimonas pelagia]|uniref:Uncharacterized protein n=2 Tax=Ferrimonas pelagia TaxID=1177826 RepID=A0ABP9ETU8_9GAMM
MMSYVKLTMQNAVREAARYAVTGRTNLDPEDSGNREAAVLQKLIDSSQGLFDRVTSTDDIKVTNSSGNPVTGYGGPGQVVVINIRCQWPILNPFMTAVIRGNNYQFTVAATMKNESF